MTGAYETPTPEPIDRPGAGRQRAGEPSSMRITALLTDAFGGSGGIAKFNRDLLTAFSSDPRVEETVAFPRLLTGPIERLPEKLDFRTDSATGKLRYAAAVLRHAFRRDADSAGARSRLLVCGHINLLSLAFSFRALRPMPVMLIVHGIDAWTPTRSPLANRLVRSVDCLVGVSEFTIERFRKWSGVPAERCRLLPDCVDTAQFGVGAKDVRLLERYGLGGRKVMMTLGRLSAQERYKGVDELLEVMPRLIKRIPGIAYLICGDGTDRGRLQQKAASLGLDGHVVFAGRIPEEEKADHYRLSDVFAMPGRGEGFGIVYLEAMACGVPVVASSLDASREAVLDGKMGLVVNPDDPDALVSAVLAAFDRPAGRIPKELDHFSFGAFERRVHRLMGQFEQV